MKGDDYFVWICLECGQQHRGPGAHSMAGDDVCSCSGEGYSSPKLARLEVTVADEGVRSRLYRARHAIEKRLAARRLEEAA